MDDVLSMEQIGRRLGVKYDLVRKWRSQGKLPPPDVVMGPRRLVWYASTIDQWHQGR